MSALPQTKGFFGPGRPVGNVGVGPLRPGCAHRLLLGAEDMIDVSHVLRLLRDAYHEVVLASRERDFERRSAEAAQRGNREGRRTSEHETLPERGTRKSLEDAEGGSKAGARAPESALCRVSPLSAKSGVRSPAVSGDNPCGGQGGTDGAGGNGTRANNAGSYVMAGNSSVSTADNMSRADAVASMQSLGALPPRQSARSGARALFGRLLGARAAVVTPVAPEDGGGAAQRPVRPASKNVSNSTGSPLYTPSYVSRFRQSRASRCSSRSSVGIRELGSEMGTLPRMSQAGGANTSGHAKLWLPQGTLAAVDASGAFPDSFFSQAAHGYFARARETDEGAGTPRADGADGEPSCSGAAVAALARGVLSDEAIVQLLERAVRQVVARQSALAARLGVGGSACALGLIALLVTNVALAARALSLPYAGAQLVDAGAFAFNSGCRMVAGVLAALALLGLSPASATLALVRLALVCLAALHGMLAVDRLAEAHVLLLFVALPGGPSGRAGGARGGAQGVVQISEAYADWPRGSAQSGALGQRQHALARATLDLLMGALLASSALALLGRAALAGRASDAARARRRRLARSAAGNVEELTMRLWVAFGAQSALTQGLLLLVQIALDLSAGFGPVGASAVRGGGGADKGRSGAARHASLALASLSALTAMLLGTLALLKPARARAQAALNRLLPASGAHAPLAALIGFGTSAAREPTELTAEALSSFAPVALDPPAFAALDFGRASTADGRTSLVAGERSVGRGGSIRSAGKAAAAKGDGGASGPPALADLDKRSQAVVELLQQTGAQARGRRQRGGSPGGGSRRSGARAPARRASEGSVQPSNVSGSSDGSVKGVTSGGRGSGGSGAAESSARTALRTKTPGSTQSKSRFGYAALELRERSLRGITLGGSGGGSGGAGAGAGCGGRRAASAALDRLLRAPARRLAASAAGFGSGSFWPASATAAGGSRAELPPVAMVADFFVAHALGNDVDRPDVKAEALRAWALDFLACEGRHPAVWLDALSSDPLLSPSEQLAHMPVYMARCSRLLLLCGPSIADSLRTVAQLYAWRASGGLMSKVECVLVAPRAMAPAERQVRWQATVAAFDAFHVLYATPGGAAPEEVERIVHAVELATVSHFNETIRSFMVPVQQAATAEAARRGAQLEAERNTPRSAGCARRSMLGQPPAGADDEPAADRPRSRPSADRSPLETSHEEGHEGA